MPNEKKARVIAETGAASTVCYCHGSSPDGMECEIYMGKEDTERQALNVYRMELLRARSSVVSGTRR